MPCSGVTSIGYHETCGARLALLQTQLHRVESNRCPFVLQPRVPCLCVHCPGRGSYRAIPQADTGADNWFLNKEDNALAVDPEKEAQMDKIDMESMEVRKIFLGG